jgi:rhodanese-related sulfurtransferase
MTGGEREPIPLEIDARTFHGVRASGGGHAVVDVREPWEVEICGFPEAVAIPLQQLPGRLDDLPPGSPLVVVCHSGQRSLRAAEFLRAHGLAHATSLSGGVEDWALTVDPTMPRY